MAYARSSPEIDLQTAASSQALAVLSVAPEAAVLQLGSADDGLTRELAERGCRVTVLGGESDAGRAVHELCERFVAGDPEAIDLRGALGETSFDAVLLIDTLQYVRDPVAMLRSASAQLGPSGRVIASVRNATHAALRLGVLAGRLPHAEAVDAGGAQLHFFDRPALEGVFARAGLTVIDRLRTTAALTDTDADIDPVAFPPEAVELALAGADADTYEFVYVATPTQLVASTRSLGEVLQRQISDLRGLLSRAEERIRSLEVELSERDALAQREDDARARVRWLEDELRRRIEALERANDDLRHAKLDVAIKDEQLARLEAELAPLRARVDQFETVLGGIGRSLTERIRVASRRTPRLRRRLKRIADWIGELRA